MKLSCDLCGGTLQVNLGGQGATCTTCGLAYPMRRLREMLTGSVPVKQEPVQPEPVNQEPVMPKPVQQETVQPKPVQQETVQQETVKSKPVHPVVLEPVNKIIPNVTAEKQAEPANRGFDYQPKQFFMDNTGRGKGDLSGPVRRGGIGVGDPVYIDGDYNHPYTVYLINDDPCKTCVKEGAFADLFLSHCPKKILKTARVVTGNRNPVANAYNYPGTVQEYFSQLLRSEFSQYEFRENVVRSELKIPVNYLLCRGGKAVLAVMLVDSNSSSARSQADKAARLFASEGAACICFFENYRNDAPYVIARVRKALG